MKSKDFLRSKGILSNDSHHFIIDFYDGREINLGDLLEEYAQQSQPSGMRCEEYTKRLEHIINTKEKERVKWADMCIKKQKRIEELESGYDKTSFAFFAQVEPKEVLLKKYYDANTKGWSEDMHNEWGNLVREDFNEWYKGYLYAIESSPAGAAEGASEGMAEALRKDIFRLDELRRFHIEPYNLGEMGEVSKIISRLSKLASLCSPGSGWVNLVDELPNYGTIDVWVSDEYSKRRIPNSEYRQRDFYNKSDRFEAFMHTDDGMRWVDITNMVTHWRPLPAPPGE